MPVNSHDVRWQPCDCACHRLMFDPNCDIPRHAAGDCCEFEITDYYREKAVRPLPITEDDGLRYIRKDGTADLGLYRRGVFLLTHTPSSRHWKEDNA